MNLARRKKEGNAECTYQFLNAWSFAQAGRWRILHPRLHSYAHIRFEPWRHGVFRACDHTGRNITYLALYASNTRVYRTPSSSKVTLSAVMALWLGISIAASFRLLTYAIRSKNGIRIARPGCRILLNFPIRSTIQAVCCGTNRTIVFAGKEGRWKYDDGTFEFPLIPSIPVFGARDLWPAWSCRLCR